MEITVRSIEIIFSQQLRSLPLKGGGKNGGHISRRRYTNLSGE